MPVVHELFDAFPFEEPARVLERDESLLLSGPPKLAIPIVDHPRLGVIHFPATFEPIEFAPPRGVYESDHIRIEWQTMDFRQPFYHRNLDVDELAYQVDGDRTLMTELGTLELTPGDYTRIPVGVAHDNWGRQDIHLLIYAPAPFVELRAADERSEMRIPPFAGWEPAIVAEAVTECLAGPAHDIVVSQADERKILSHAETDDQRLTRLHPPRTVGTTWLYRSTNVVIGQTVHEADQGLTYTRHRNADEIQYQAKGERLLVSQRGTVLLQPGDFVRIPVGVAFTSIVRETSHAVTIATALAVPQVAPTAKEAEPWSAEQVDAYRGDVVAPRETEPRSVPAV